MTNNFERSSTVPPHSILNDIDPDENFFNEVHGGLQMPKESKYYSIQRYNSTFSTSARSLDILSCNVRSYDKNSDSFRAVLESLYKQPEIIVLTETWRKADDHTTYMWEGYCEHHTVWNVGRSGGESVLCMNNLRVRLVPELTVRTDTIESCVVEVTCGGETLVIFAIYRPHSDTIENFSRTMYIMLHKNVLNGKQVIFIGDVNVDLLKCNSNYIAEFIDMMQSVTFTPVITKATRFSPGNSHGAPSLLN